MVQGRWTERKAMEVSLWPGEDGRLRQGDDPADTACPTNTRTRKKKKKKTKVTTKEKNNSHNENKSYNMENLWNCLLIWSCLCVRWTTFAECLPEFVRWTTFAECWPECTDVEDSLQVICWICFIHSCNSFCYEWQPHNTFGCQRPCFSVYILY